MKFLWRLGAVALIIVLVYWLTVPTSRVHIRADSYEAPFVEQAWKAVPHRELFLLNKSSVLDGLAGLPVTVLEIRRQRPWDADIQVAVRQPDIVIRQGSRMAAVFADEGTAYLIQRAKASWNIVDVQGFPKKSESFLAMCLQNASLCGELMAHRKELGLVSMRYSSSSLGLTAQLKDGKVLILGDSADSTSKVLRGISVMNMPAFKMRKVTIDLRFNGQAVIPEAP